MARAQSNSDLPVNHGWAAAHFPDFGKIFDTRDGNTEALETVNKIDQLSLQLVDNCQISEKEGWSFFIQVILTFQLNKAQLVSLLGVNEVTIARWENGTSAPSMALRKLYRREIMDFLDRSELTSQV